MTTKIEIVAAAANLLGKPSINDLNANPQFAAMGKRYDSLVGNYLSKLNWRFATKTDALDVLSTAPDIEDYTYQLQIPTDCIALWRFWPSNINFDIYQDKIYTNTNALRAEYTFNPGESKFPPWFILLLEYGLAADTAMMVTQNTSIANLWKGEARIQEAVAMSIDAKQRPNKPVQYDPLYIAHFGSGRGVY